MMLKKSENLSSLYLAAVGMLTFCKAIAMSGNSRIYQGVFLICVVLWLIKVINDSWTLNQLIVLLILGVIVAINYLISGKETLIVTYLLFSGMKGISVKNVLRITFLIRLIGFLLVIMLVLLGIRENVATQFWRNGEFITRYSLGFGHPNLFHSSFFMIVLLYLTVIKRKKDTAILIIIGVLNYIVYVLSSSRTGYIITLILLIAIFAVEKSRYARKILYGVLPYIQIMFTFVTFFIAKYLPGSSIYALIDKLLTGRFTYSTRQLDFFPNLFGHNFNSSDILFDNSYSMMLSMYGIVISLIFTWGYWIIAKKITKNKNNMFMIILIMMSILFFAESYLPSGLMNFTIYIMGGYFFDYPNSSMNINLSNHRFLK